MLLVQFAIPPNYVLPRTYIEDRPVGMQSRNALRGQLSAESKKISISFDSRTQEFTAAEVGITTDVEATLAQLPTIALIDRAVPFLPLYKAAKRDVVRPVAHKNTTAIEAFAQTMSERLKTEPVNAAATIKDGQLVISKDEDGRMYVTSTIERALMESNPLSARAISVTSRKTPAKVQAADFEPLISELAAKTQRTLKVRYGDVTKTIEAKSLGAWLMVAQSPETGKWSLVTNPEAVQTHIQTWAQDYNIPAGTTQVTYYDNVETSRKTGAFGRALDAAAIQQQIARWFASPTDEPVVLAVSVVQPREVATRTYSSASAQLQAQLNAWVASHSGRYQIAIRELGGAGREASYNVAQQTVMASTYKPFLAFVAYSQAENGALDLNTPMGNGKNIEQCIDVMIVNSDNDCPVRLGKHIGWAKVDQIIAAAGFSDIRLNNYNPNGSLNGDKLVNAREQAKFLAQLSAGSLMNQTNTNKLLGYMKRQIYRNGIPAGSRGSVVADKVGFFDAYLHDVGIVYGPKSTYALVIMSEGSSWANIKDLAQAVYDFMNG